MARIRKEKEYGEAIVAGCFIATISIISSIIIVKFVHFLAGINWQ